MIPSSAFFCPNPRLLKLDAPSHMQKSPATYTWKRDFQVIPEPKEALPYRM